MDAGASAPSSSGADASGGGVTPAPDPITDTTDIPIAPVYAMGRYSRTRCFINGYKKCRK